MKKRLGDIATYVNGYAFKPSDRGAKGLPIIRIQDLTGNSYDLGYYDGIYPEKIEINDGDILISWSGSLGIYIWNHGKALLNQHIFKVVFDKGDVNKQYFVFAVQYKLQEMMAKTHGATMKHIVKKDFDNTLIPFPALEAQSEIADILLRVNAIISVRKKQIKMLDELIKSRFVEMFTRYLRVDKGWSTQPLGELCTIVRGGSPRPIEKFLGGSIPWIKISDATDEESVYLHSTKEHIIQEGVSKSRMVKNGSLIFANCGVSLGFARIITFDGCIHDGWLALEDIDSRLDKVFLLQALNQMTEHFRKIAPAGTQPNLNTTIMKAYMQIIPPMQLQKEFIAFCTQTDKSKLIIQKSLDELETLNKALMQKYFGGYLRVNVIMEILLDNTADK